MERSSKGITASGLVYLFGERFAKESGRFGSSETLLYSGRKVSRRELAYRLFEAAFFSLAQEGYISLGVGKRKVLLVMSKETVTVSKAKEGDDLPPSLERSILEECTGEEKKDNVRELVRRVIGGDCDDPWGGGGFC